MLTTERVTKRLPTSVVSPMESFPIQQPLPQPVHAQLPQPESVLTESFIPRPTESQPQQVVQPIAAAPPPPELQPRRLVPNRPDFEGATKNYVSNYGPKTMYADFKYKNMNYEQTLEFRKKKYMQEQNYGGF